MKYFISHSFAFAKNALPLLFFCCKAFVINRKNFIGEIDQFISLLCLKNIDNSDSFSYFNENITLLFQYYSGKKVIIFNSLREIMLWFGLLVLCTTLVVCSFHAILPYYNHCLGCVTTHFLQPTTKNVNTLLNVKPALKPHSLNKTAMFVITVPNSSLLLLT